MRKGFEAYESNIKETLEALAISVVAFTEGRRNDDMFNWIMCMMAMTETDQYDHLTDELISEWEKFYSDNLNQDQKESMSDWDRDVEDMIAYCCYAYMEDDPIMFGQLWIEMDDYVNPFTKPID